MLINYKSYLKHALYSKFSGTVKFVGLKIYSRQLNKLYANVEEHYKQHGKYPLFTSVEVETINRCNNICPFCPVNKNDDIRTKKRMSETLFHSIVNNLEDLKFKGGVLSICSATTSHF